MKQFFKQKNRNKFTTGFTLVETLVAVAIFTLAVVTMMTVLVGNLSNTGYAKNKMIASYLAQEGIEYMRNLRDTYVLYSPSTDQGWADFNKKLTNAQCQNKNRGCYFNADNLDYNDNNQPMIGIKIANCQKSTCSDHVMHYDPGTGKYNYTVGPVSSFTRVIISQKISNDETKISSKVYWTQSSGTYSITLSESVYNWIQ